MARDKGKDVARGEIDLDEVKKLVDALERDLAKVQRVSGDLQVLRDEVETLKNVLESPIRRHHWVREGLHDMREAFESALEGAVAEGIKASRYIAEIGRILGIP
jgi:predicted  nucleic acid-binding Zn-ribbon protein